MSSCRIVFVTQEDPFYVRLFFEEFFAKCGARENIAAVVIAPTMGKKSITKLAGQMYEFYGPLDFVRMSLKYLWYRIAARLPWAGRSGRFYSIEQVCRHYGVPVIETPNVNAPAFLSNLRGIAPDLVVSVAAPQIFKDPLIQLPRFGCINIHNAKLPKYRGMLPNFWQMFNGETVLGATVHRINASLDDGAILAQSETATHPGESLHAVICRTKRQGAHLVISVIERIGAGTITELPNPKEESSYYTFPKKADVREFRRRGYRLL
jgi:methionyl-tRNA formyltransferase